MKKMSQKFDPHKPIPYHISPWDSRTEIFYKCSECGQNFKFFAEKELFCHNCGLKQDWSTSPKYCSDEFKKEYENLVYEQGAYLQGTRPQDEQLVALFRDLYFGVRK